LLLLVEAARVAEAFQTTAVAVLVVEDWDIETTFPSLPVVHTQWLSVQAARSRGLVAQAVPLVAIAILSARQP
jgi:hypothetical protein